MELTVRYQIDKDEIHTIKMQKDSTIDDLIKKINEQHKTTKYKYVYMKEINGIIDEGETLSDHITNDESLLYILENPTFNFADFEVEKPFANSSKTKSSSSSDDDTPKKHKSDSSKKKIKADSSKTKLFSSESSDDDAPKKRKSSSTKKETKTDSPSPSYSELSDDDDEGLPASLLETQIPNAILIKLKKKQKKEDFNNEYFFVYSTQSYEQMTNPVRIELPFNSTYAQTEEKIRNSLDISKDFQIHIFLSTGVQFFKTYEGKENALENFYNNADIDTNHNIYVVITNPIDQDDLEGKIEEICNVSNEKMKHLISPVCESTEIGYSRIACLLGTLYYNENQLNNFIRSVARCTGFAPLISYLLSLITREEITGLMVATISAALHSIFTKLLPKTTKKREVFDRCLECACYVAHAEKTYSDVQKNKTEPEKLQILRIDIDNASDGFSEYLKKCNQTGFFYPYQPDFNYANDFSLAILDQNPDPTQLESIFNNYTKFCPNLPLKAREQHIPCIMLYTQGKTCLFLNSLDEDDADPNQIKIIDPFKGVSEIVDIEKIAEKVANDSNDRLKFLIDPNDVEELNVIVLDASGSMYNRLDGEAANLKKNDIRRCFIATKCIRTFLRMSFLYRLPHVFSFMSFNKEPSVPTQFSPLSPEIEEALSKVKFKEKSVIWDALDDAITHLAEKEKKETFPNARLRIIVFSDGIDEGSKKSKTEVCKHAINENITIDSIIFTSNNECDDLCNFSHFTGGYAYRSEDVNEYYSFFEKESFLNLSIRDDKNEAEDSDKVNDDLFKNSRAIYDKDIANFQYITQSTVCTIYTPNFVMAEYKKNSGNTISRLERRILKEMKIFQHENNENIKLYVKPIDVKNKSEVTSWKVFMEGPEKSEYENYWWFLSIVFTSDYPLRPPLFRFISPPYHINISEDGRVCSSFLLSNYKSTDSVYELVVKTRNLLGAPEEKYAIQEFKLNLWKNNEEEFDKMVKKFCEDEYKDFESCIKEYRIIKDDKSFTVDEKDFEDDENILNITTTTILRTSSNEDK